MNNIEKNLNIVVIKRDGKKVPFNGSKIAIAVKQGFDNAYINEENKYTEKDVNKIYNLVLNAIIKKHIDRIKIEEIQDIIEEKLQEEGYQDVYKSFSLYRERRNQSRKIFFDEKKQHKLLKALEKLGLKNSQEDDCGIQLTARDTLLKYGSTVSQEFAKAYLIKNKYIQAHEAGEIFIHNIDFIPMGTTQNVNINLNKLFEQGFYVGNQYIEEPKDIIEYAELTSTVIRMNMKDQHGEQAISLFDFYMAAGVLKTFKREFKNLVNDFLDYNGFKNFIALNGITREIEKINSIDFDIAIFDSYTRDTDTLKQLFRLAYDKALIKTNILTYKAIEVFMQNINIDVQNKNAGIDNITLSCGTDVSLEGRMVTNNLLLLLENKQEQEFPIIVFKIKENVNLKSKDRNYDLFKKACKIAEQKGIPRFSFLDAQYNLEYYNQYDSNTEASYIGEGIRVLENKVDESKSITSGRGNLSAITINLPRIGIKHGIKINEKVNIEEFYKELEDKLELVKEALIERFEIQCSKRIYNFPFLIGQEVWIDSDKAKDMNKLKKSLKNGNFVISFVGLAECLQALIGETQYESEKAQTLGLEIVKFMKNRIEQFSEHLNLNFVLSGAQEKYVAEKFIAIDRAIYGKLNKINDKKCYTNSFEIPENIKISNLNKIKLETPYHQLTKGGHILKMRKNKTDNIEDIIESIYKSGIGYIKFNI